MNERWAIIQPTHVDQRLLPIDTLWSNDSFNNLSKLFQARLYHITQNNIPEDYDVYWLINFDIELIDKEILFLKRVKEKGAKIIIGFSQDWRFLLGKKLISSSGTLYTELCEIADVIGGGINFNYGAFGRYQNKVVDMGEILWDLDFSIPLENRNIDFLVSGCLNGFSHAYEIELLSLIHEKYPDKKLAICIPDMHEIKYILMKKYPFIYFPMSEEIKFMDVLKNAKTYCNLEIRPRGGRCLIEAYYCRVPFISSYPTYFSRLCPDTIYNHLDVNEVFEKYKILKNSNLQTYINDMEEKAKYDYFENVYKRIKEKIF